MLRMCIITMSPAYMWMHMTYMEYVYELAIYMYKTVIMFRRDDYLPIYMFLVTYYFHSINNSDKQTKCPVYPCQIKLVW